MELKNVETNLREAGYAVSIFDTADEARAYLDAQVDGKSVGFGGSMTLDQLGLYETLSRHNTVHWHWRMPADKNEVEVRAAAAAAEVYFSSVNALAESGEIINIDNVCNRVAAILYGHEQVYLVLGENKIAPDLAGAIDRARNIAAPLNAKRLGCATPCAVKGDRCYDCQSPGRICRGLSVLWRAPAASHIEIVLIRETLGY